MDAVQRGQAALEGRFDALEGRFVALEGRFNGLEALPREALGR